LTPPLLYALALTGSRSGLVALAAAFAGILVKARNRMVLGIIGALVVVVGYSALAPDMQDRYLSIFGGGEKNRATFEGRVEGVKGDFQIVLRRPVFGHGLGTSREANANLRGNDQLSHNLYTEVGQELGLAGLFIFLLFIGAITINFIRASKQYPLQEKVAFSKRVVDGMQVWLVMNIISSFASYGLLSYEWYLFGGLSVVVRNLSEKESREGFDCKG
jgi:putative inorganic carbon (hco3(-)) transporter